MQVKLYQGSGRPKTDVMVLFYWEKSKVEDHPWYKFLSATDKKYLQSFFGQEFIGKFKQHSKFTSVTDHGQKILLIGLGEQRLWQGRRAQLIARLMVKSITAPRLKSMAVDLRPLENVTGKLPLERLVELMIENAIMANYAFNQYLTKPKQGWPEIKSLEIQVNKEHEALIKKSLMSGRILGEEVNACRDLANTPGGDMTPEILADKAKVAGESAGVKVTVLDKKGIVTEGMGGLLGVAKGSKFEPRFIIMEYQGGTKDEAPVVFVGKGITFDTGGLCLKPDMAMLTMHLDMSGGAAVIHAVVAIARLKLPVNVVGLVPAAENTPGGESYRPGDLLKSLNGKTIQVDHTDAEGRIILADGLAYATRFRPSLIVDVATLTGAACTALGDWTFAVMSPDDELAGKISTMSMETGDYAWPLPLWEEYDDFVKGTFADVTNVGKTKMGGAIIAGAFLKNFVPIETPWAHLDIASTAMTIAEQHLSKGASGAGVRLLTAIAANHRLLTVKD